MYQVLARKWRPQGFDELVGQRHVRQTLVNAVESGRLAHAYIFAGLRGTGKTTVARILAKCLNCQQGPTAAPCGKCDACTEIAESRAIDVLELDAASRTSVNDVRELQEVIAYAPVRDRYKVLIIDEAHMLSKQAFNALLKTLEEPPPNVIFMLATTELQKILPTILSRCQVFEFRRVTPKEMTALLTRMCEAEEIEISPASLERIARAGEGSVRDSLSVLERVLAFCGREVDDEQVLRVLGAVRAEVLVEMIAALAARDAGRMLGVLDSLVDEGHDLIHFWGELIGVLRDLLCLRAVEQPGDLLSRSADEAKALDEAARELGREDLTRAFQILADLEAGLKSSSQPRFLFEAALVRLASLGSVRPIEEVLAGLSGSVRAPTSPEKKTTRDARRAPAAPAPAPKPAPTPTTRSGDDLSARIVARIVEKRPMLGAILGQALGASLGDDRWIVRFDKSHSAVAATLQKRENVTVLQQEAEAVAGRPIRIEVDVSAKTGGEPRPDDAPSVAAEQAEQAEQTDRPTGARGPSLLQRARQEPGVHRLLDEFAAEVVEFGPLEAATALPEERRVDDSREDA